MLWEQDDTRICRIAGARPSFAHVIPFEGLAQTQPKNGHDITQVERYVAALEVSTPAEFRWEGSGAATVRAMVQAGHVVSLQVNHHPGWSARANGRRAEIRRDGLGLMVLASDCSGPCDIRLVYDGGWEQRLCRGSSMLTAVSLMGWGTMRWRRRRLGDENATQ